MTGPPRYRTPPQTTAATIASASPDGEIGPACPATPTSTTPRTATQSSAMIPSPGRSPNAIAIAAAAAPSHEMIGVTTETGQRANAV